MTIALFLFAVLLSALTVMIAFGDEIVVICVLLGTLACFISSMRIKQSSRSDCEEK